MHQMQVSWRTPTYYGKTGEIFYLKNKLLKLKIIKVALKRQQSAEEKTGQRLIDARRELRTTADQSESETLSDLELNDFLRTSRILNGVITPAGHEDPTTTSLMLDLVQKACHNPIPKLRNGKDSFEYAGIVSSFPSAFESEASTQIQHKLVKSEVEMEAERILNAKYEPPPSSSNAEDKFSHLGLLKQLFPNQKDEVSNSYFLRHTVCGIL